MSVSEIQEGKFDKESHVQEIIAKNLLEMKNIDVEIEEARKVPVKIEPGIKTPSTS